MQIKFVTEYETTIATMREIRDLPRLSKRKAKAFLFAQATNRISVVFVAFFYIAAIVAVYMVSNYNYFLLLLTGLIGGVVVNKYMIHVLRKYYPESISRAKNF